MRKSPVIGCVFKQHRIKILKNINRKKINTGKL